MESHPPEANSVARDTDTRPLACIASFSFGIASEAWLYRQVTGMERLRVGALTWNRENEQDYPDRGVSVAISPESPGAGPIKRQLRGYANFIRGNGTFNGDRNETQWLSSYFQETKPQVALAHYSVLALRLLPLCTAHNIPLVAHFHGFDISAKLSNRHFARRLVKNLNRFAACVCVASYQREWLLAHGADPAKVHLIPCGAPVTEIPLAHDVGKSPCRFIMVGRLVEKKRPDLSVKAFAKCAVQCPGVELTVIGDGPKLAECEQLARSLGVSENIHWLGVQSNEFVRDALSRSSVFLQHSVTAVNGNKEGWPVSIAEAAAAGLPVVSTRHAGILDQIEEAVSGYLVDEGDWESMADHMISLAQKPDERMRMGGAARQGILRFDVSNQIAQLEDVLLCIARKNLQEGAFVGPNGNV